MKKILLHICCGPCGLHPLAVLRAEGLAVTGYFFNHNIHPYQEYVRRRDAAVQMAELEGLELIMQDEYRLEEFLANVAAEPENRCSYCYVSRLTAAARTAAERGFDGFTSSLFYSRYQDHKLMLDKAEELAEQFQIPFVYRDFRTGWQDGIKRSKELGLYRQQYCGCIYSEKGRYQPRPKK